MATVDLSHINYYVEAVLSDGTQLHLQDVAENIAWEENENELAVRLNLTLRDVPYGSKRLSQVLSLCTAVFLFADWGEGQMEIFRGAVWRWENSDIKDDQIVLTVYDMLFYLQKSKDSMYFTAGKSTMSIVNNIFSTWGITAGVYEGPNVIHQKIIYKSKTVASMLTETLNDAKKLGGGKGIIRAIQGRVHVLRYGTNKTVYSFRADSNLTQSRDVFDMTSLVTRVVIYGKEDTDGRPVVETTLVGKVQYGILQDTQAKGSLTLEEAKKKAQDTLDEKGEPKRSITLNSPDLPAVRKGDVIHAVLDNLSGYFYVIGVSHNATTMTMQMEVEPV